MTPREATPAHTPFGLGNLLPLNEQHRPHKSMNLGGDLQGNSQHALTRVPVRNEVAYRQDATTPDRQAPLHRA
jgi:hypothetical protein